jgi:HSP20 family molecular chaperone IbpA
MEATSEYNNGLLTIRVPLSKTAEPKQIEVKTNLQLNQ